MWAELLCPFGAEEGVSVGPSPQGVALGYIIEPLRGK
jgi:hypothetical protein